MTESPMSAITPPTPRFPTQTTSAPTDLELSSPAAALSVRRLNIMRIGYFIMGVGLAVTQWPLLINRSEPWPLMEGVVTYMLVAMGLLALMGLRHPVKMLPILLFESAWKVIWLTAVALPLWLGDRMDPATAEVAGASLWVIIVLAVIPWRYVIAQYVMAKGDPWRRGSAVVRQG